MTDTEAELPLRLASRVLSRARHPRVAHRRLIALEDGLQGMAEAVRRLRQFQRRTNIRVAASERRAATAEEACARLETRLVDMSRLLIACCTDPTSDRLFGDGQSRSLWTRLDNLVTDRSGAAAVLRILADAGQPLAAAKLATTWGVVDRLPRAQLRSLGKELRLRGYLVAGLAFAEAAARVGNDWDAEVLRLRQEEIDVLSGAFEPRLQRYRVSPLPGRVLHVVGFSLPYKQSGYTLRTQHTVAAQAAVGLDAHVVTQVGITEGTGAATDDVLGVRYHRMPGPLRSKLGLASWLQLNTEQLAEVVARVRPAVLHAHSDFLNALSALAVGDATGIPVVYEARGFWEESWLSRTSNEFGWTDYTGIETAFGKPDAYVWRREREEAARLRATHVVTLAGVMSRRILASGLPPDRLSLVPNAVDVDAFTPTTKRDAALARQHDLQPAEMVVGYISSLVEYEGVDTLIEAFARLRAVTDRPLRLLIVGDGDERTHLESLAAATAVRGIVFTGRVPHELVTRYYSLIDVFVVPRRPSDVSHLVTPLKPYEAFATGRTVVLSDVEALQEIADESGAAATFTAGNPESLVRVLEELVEDPDRRRKLAAAGTEWVRANRTWDVNAQAYLQVYDRLGVAPVGEMVHS